MPRPWTARVIVASNRASAGVYEDRSGPLLVEGLVRLGCQVSGPVVVPDGDPVGDALRQAVGDRVDVVVTSGGTGINPTDRTPEVTRRVLDYEVPGIAEALFATAIGLIAAIPATIFYNKFISDVNKQAQRLEGFADEFAAILSRQIDERG